MAKLTKKIKKEREIMNENVRASAGLPVRKKSVEEHNAFGHYSIRKKREVGGNPKASIRKILRPAEQKGYYPKIVL